MGLVGAPGGYSPSISNARCWGSIGAQAPMHGFSRPGVVISQKSSFPQASYAFVLRLQVNAYTAPVSETVSLAEALAAHFAAHPSLSETVSLAEAMAVVGADHAYLSESVTLAEALASRTAAHPALAEMVTLAEALATGAAAFTSLAETVSLAESMAAVGADHASLSESVSLAEALGTSAASFVGVSEAVSLNDALACVAGAVVGVSDAVALSDALAARLHAISSLAETVSLGESVVGVAVTHATGTVLSVLLLFEQPATQVRLLEDLARTPAASLLLVGRGREEAAVLVLASDEVATLKVERAASEPATQVVITEEVGAS